MSQIVAFLLLCLFGFCTNIDNLYYYRLHVPVLCPAASPVLRSLSICIKSYLSTSYHTIPYHFKSDDIILDPTIVQSRRIAKYHIMSYRTLSSYHFMLCFIVLDHSVLHHTSSKFSILHHIKVLLKDITVILPNYKSL